MAISTRPTTDAGVPRPDQTRGGRLMVAGWAVLIAVAFGWGYVLRRTGSSPEDVLPPLHATARMPTLRILPAAVVAVALVLAVPVVCRRLRWRWSLVVCWLAAVLWTVALAVTDGRQGLTGPLTSAGEYFAGLPPVLADPLGWLRTFSDDALRYPTHVAGHPPGPMMVLWALDAAGLHGPGWAAALLIGAGTSSVVAIAVTVRALAGEETARRLLPFLVLAPLAVWVATTMDALFLGAGAWAAALLASASGRRAVIWAAGAGLLFGALPYLSYGLLPLFALGPAILLVTRPRRPVVGALLAGCLVVPLVFTALGFWWPDGVAVTQDAYAMTGGSARRSYLYFLVGNLAVLGLLTGPAAAYGLARCGEVFRRPASWTPSARAAVMAVAALVGMVVLDLSSVTRGEVERIWLPYAAWAMAAAVHVTPARRWLAVQAGLAVAVQALVLSPW